MKIFIEGESYPIDVLEKTFKSGQFYSERGFTGVIKAVGYYHSQESNQLTFMLPKVFMRDEELTVFDLSKTELYDWIKDDSIKHDHRYIWVRNLSVYLYKSLITFRNRYPNSDLINYSSSYQLRALNKSTPYSYLDILLSFVDFYKKHKSQILFKHIDSISNTARKPKWEKTIRKENPILLNSGVLIYDQIQNKHKLQNREEELIIYFFSIINHFNEQHDLDIKIDKIYPIIKGRKFIELKNNGLRKLKKIKYRYYSDVLKSMHQLCMLYFAQFDQAKSKSKEDFIIINNYNIVFEDMIDKLFSADLNDVVVYDTPLKTLKKNDDGKVLDHIFDHRSIFDGSDIFYIGDSKYYKSGSEAGKISRYKQFTYAKNIIQFNIDLLNDNDRRYSEHMRYRDELTEGYNITPNFFIYGYIDDPNDYDSFNLKTYGDVVSTSHFEQRLFDRDSLFVHQYKINFLFVLKAYSLYGFSYVQDFKKNVKDVFRNEFILYFKDPENCGYSFYQLNGDVDKSVFMKDHFRIIYGKCYNTSEGRFLLAKHKDDNSLSDDIMKHFSEYFIN